LEHIVVPEEDLSFEERERRKNEALENEEKKRERLTIGS